MLKLLMLKLGAWMVRQMSDIEEKIDELFDDFEESKLYKDYLSVQDKISKDKEIISVINEIKKFYRQKSSMPYYTFLGTIRHGT